VQISKRITRWRESRDGLTKSELARRVGVSSAAVAQWESGNTAPTHEHIEAIVKEVGISLADFWGAVPPARRKKRAA
jgi:transcriptional regulator with XRE-family HTH domain